MKWLRANLKDVAPSQASTLRFDLSEEVWHLNLDQIESDTGNIVNKKVALVSESGSSTYVFDQTNVLYSKLRPYLNKVVCPNEPGIATSELVPLKPNPSVLDRHYLTYNLRSREFLNFANVAVAGVKMPRIIMHKFWHHKIPLPTLSEQCRIVEILDHANDLRKKRNEADGKAARILPALFYRMFGDPATNPKGWPVKAFDDVIEDRTAQFPKLQKNQYHTTGRFPVVDQGKELVAGYSDDDTLIPAADYPVIVFGDHTRIIKYVDFPFIAGADGSRIFVTKEGFNPAFTAMQLELQPIPNLGYSRHMREVRRLQFIAPPTSLQKEYENLAIGVRPLINDQALSFSRLDSIWQNLLSRAFTGDLTAKWREAHMKELLVEMEAQAKTLELINN